MLRAIIIEDERPALQGLLHTLAEVCPQVSVTATLNSVKESLEYIPLHTDADLIISDVQLSDGLSFEIFSQLPIKTPVIFITGYDQFMMSAFEYNGIDYLLKPIEKEELKKAISKYEMLEKHFTASSPMQMLSQFVSHKKRTRLVVRKGLENIALKLEDIVLFYTENKLVYVLDKNGKKYIADRNLSDLEVELDETFFRANRQYLINIQYVKGYKPFDKVKLLVDLLIPELNHCIIVSQETAPAFRKWIYQA